MSMPLEGVRILDFSQSASGPMFTQLLSEFGAEIIKLENPPMGDPARQENIILENGFNTSYASRDMDKKSVVLNLRDPYHKELFFKMVETADAVVENYKVGTMEKLGVGYDELKKVNPRIVLTSVSGYGQDGPYADHAAYNPAVQAESGLMSLTGQPGPDFKPTLAGAPIPDYVGGLMGCIGTLIAIMDAKKTGHGRHVDASMMDATIYMYENLFSMYAQSGKIPQPMGSRFPSGAPQNVFTCKDGVPIMMLIYTNDNFKSFAEMMGQPQWLENPDYATIALRAQNYIPLEAEVAELIAQYDSAELAEMLQARKLVWGYINDFERLKNHPQVEARKVLVDSVYPDGTTFQCFANPLKMSGVELKTRYDAYPLGHHTIEILSQFDDPAKVHEKFDPLLESLKK